MSARSNGKPLWEIRWPGGFTFFAGTIEEMGREINRRHLETGVQHAAREIRN